MDFFPKWHGTLELPPLPERRITISGNAVIQRVFGGARCKANIRTSQFNGHDLITFDALEAPYREVLLRHRGVRRIKTTMPVVAAPEVADANNLPEVLQIHWDSFGELEAYADTPEKVLQAWLNKFDFRTEDEALNLPGLRTPQIGALHAISAHFAVGTEFDAATVDRKSVV